MAFFNTNLYPKSHQMCIQVILHCELFKTQFNLSFFLS